jgi:hypothetical protein
MIILGIAWLVIALYLSLKYRHEWTDHLPDALVISGALIWLFGNGALMVLVACNLIKLLSRV